MSTESSENNEFTMKINNNAVTDDMLLPVSKDVDLAILTFVRQYELQHEVVVLEPELEKTTIKVDSTPFVSGIVRLNFKWFNKNGEGKHRSSSVLLKIPQLSPHHRLFRRLQLYRKETYMYESVLPRMYEFWPREKLTPILYASTPSDILVFENLEESGYHVRKKNTFLDFADCKVVVKSLAYFHALSMKYLESTEGNFFNLDVVFDETGETFRGCSTLFDKLRKHDVVSCLSPKARKRFDDFCSDFYSNIHFGFSPNADGFNVILHGDTHYYNVLFRPDEETKCKFVDFQCSRRGSPIVDLMYFLMTSVQIQVFERHRESLFNFYLAVLNDTSEQLGIRSPYNLDQLNADFHKYKIFFVYIIIGIVPALWSGEWWHASADSTDDVFDTVLKSEKYTSLFKKWMEYFV